MLEKLTGEATLEIGNKRYPKEETRNFTNHHSFMQVRMDNIWSAFPAGAHHRPYEQQVYIEFMDRRSG
jgi:hypothetical protein